MLRIFLITIVYWLCWTSISFSQLTVRSAYNDSAAEALTKRNVEKAEKLYRLAIKEAASVATPDDTLIESILGLSAILIDTERSPEALQMLDDALKAFEKRVQTGRTDYFFYAQLCDLLSCRARLHLLDNKAAEARAGYQPWIKLMDAEFGTNFQFVFARLVEDYSRLCEGDGDFTEVEKIYERWISAASARKSKDALDIARIRIGLASHYRRTAQNGQAEAIYKQLLEEASEDSDKFRSETTGILKELADIYMEDKRVAEAEAVLKQLLRVEERSKSEIGTAIALERLAALYMAESQYSDAEALLVRSLVLLEKHYKEYAAPVIRARLMIAECHVAEEDTTRAKEAFDSALSAIENRFQNKQNDFEIAFLLPEALASASQFYEKTDNINDVEVLLSKWIDRIEQSPSPNQNLRLTTLRMLAEFYQTHDMGMKAESVYKRRLETRTDESTDARLNQQAIRFELAILYMRNEKFASATEEIEALMGGQTGNSRLDRRRQSQNRYLLATLLEIQGKRDDAMRAEREAIEGLQNDPDRGRARRAFEEEFVGDDLIEQKAFREAENCYSSAIFRALLAIEEDPKTLSRLNEKLGRAVAAQNRNREAQVYFRRANAHSNAE
jgi:tetratricopeptide (TPR) repeat protein